MKKILIGCGIVLVAAVFVFVNLPVQYNEGSFIAMDTYMSIKICGNKKIVESTENIIQELNGVLDINSADSELSKLNCGKIKTSENEDIKQALAKAFEVAKKSDGAFNFAMYDLKKLWNINSDMTEIPTDNSIKAAVAAADYSKISVKNETVCLNGIKIDLGGIAKGYACDKAVEYLKSQKVKSAILSCGGSIALLGKKGSQNWNVEIADPRSENSALGRLSLSNSFVSTSGDYQRFGIVNGKRYHHIFGKNGYPTDNGVISVTAVSNSGADSDAYSTALMVMGAEKAVEFCEKTENLDAVIVTSDKKVFVTRGLKNDFTLTNEDYKYED